MIRSRNHVILFQPRFAALVQAGTKCQTIRPPRQRAIQVGDTLSLRQWTGKPYASKQRILRTAICTAVGPIFLDCDCTDERLAAADGFATAAEMVAWFAATHRLPFSGILIQWAGPQAPRSPIVETYTYPPAAGYDG